jgi:uncharacterized protein
VLEVDLVRKRIALSIKQTEPAPAGGKRPGGAALRGQLPHKTAALSVPRDLGQLSMNDALSALKSKFKK